MATIVVLDENCQQLHQTQLIVGSSFATTNQLREPSCCGVVQPVCLDDLGTGFTEERLVCRHHSVSLRRMPSSKIIPGGRFANATRLFGSLPGFSSYRVAAVSRRCGAVRWSRRFARASLKESL